MKSMIYLDHNATTDLRPEAMAAMSELWTHVGNPSSVHGAGRVARQAMDRARAAVARAVNVKPAEILFTSGGTEANATALGGFGWSRVFYSATEHDSVRAALPEAAPLPVDGAGLLDLEALQAALADGPALVAVMLANNETGTIQPIAEIAAMVHAAGGHLHVDAVQALGKISVDVRALQADSMSLSAHKLGGPAGIGALVIREGLDLRPLLSGGGQEMRRRSGTENLIGIVGFGAAVSRANPAEFAEAARLRDLIESLIAEVAPDAHVFSAGVARLPNTLCVAMPGVPSETQVMALDLKGICVSAGSACSSGKVQRSHVLAAMQVPDDLARTAIRVSLGRNTDEAEVRRFVDGWIGHYRKTREKALS
ncbi:cysteine desulfurase family protein [Govanella unica]|uniref:Cysteine desulfurase n=1 Tax=Govanella unica TaxID=2975056 RepID=A0A9X3TXL9_9PROT|nr:cysteine desulfurase family protein [Govania unica]MDA5193557.1 cysteine desulfurase [Govania unica]